MTRIGFAYNQKPDPVGGASHAAVAERADEEPPSRGSALATLAPAAHAAPDAACADEYAVWV
jgi:hypothetical protein